MSVSTFLRIALTLTGLTLGCGAPSLAQEHGGHHGPQSQPTKPPPERPPTATVDHSKHDMSAPSTQEANLPPLTDADRAAAFPDVKGHTVHDRAINYFVLFDQLEWQPAESGGSGSWDTKGWIGRDRDRLWFRTEGQTEDGRLDEAEVHVLYGRAFARWWDVVAGVRQDVGPGPSPTWGAIGIQGLAPYWFEVEATAYVGESGRTAVRLEAEYELLLTNRLVAQPLVELNVYGKSIPERGIGAGLSTAEAGVRVRYEFRREFAPYLGVVWHRKLGRTADFARSTGEDTGGVRLAAGVRLWF